MVLDVAACNAPARIVDQHERYILSIQQDLDNVLEDVFRMLSELIALHQSNLNNERAQPRGDKNIGGKIIILISSVVTVC